MITGFSRLRALVSIRLTMKSATSARATMPLRHSLGRVRHGVLAARCPVDEDPWSHDQPLQVGCLDKCLLDRLVIVGIFQVRA